LDKPSDFMIMECDNHYVLINKKGNVENHTHLKKKDTCHLLINLVCEKKIPHSPYLRTSAKRISRNKKYIREIEIKEEKDKQKQHYFNPQKGVRR